MGNCLQATPPFTGCQWIVTKFFIRGRCRATALPTMIMDPEIRDHSVDAAEALRRVPDSDVVLADNLLGTQSVTTSDVDTRISVLLEQAGYEDLLRGLSGVGSQRLLKGRMVEIVGRFPRPSQFDLLITIGGIPGFEDLRDYVRGCAYDESYPHARMALEALAKVEPSASQYIERKKKATIEAARKNVRTEPVIRGCCEGH